VVLSMFTAITITKTFLKILKFKNTWFFGVEKAVVNKPE